MGGGRFPGLLDDVLVCAKTVGERLGHSESRRMAEDILLETAVQLTADVADGADRSTEMIRAGTAGNLTMQAHGAVLSKLLLICVICAICGFNSLFQDHWSRLAWVRKRSDRDVSQRSPSGPGDLLSIR